MADTRTEFEQLASLYLPVMLGVVVIVSALILYPVFRRRRGPGRLSTERAGAPRIEIGVAVGLAVVAAGLAAATLVQNADFVGASEGAALDLAEADAALPATAGAEPLEVRVTGARWRWRFTYPDSGVSVTGGQPEPVVFAVPVDTPVRFELTSLDVVHSLWFPERRFKRDAFPGHINRFTIVWPEAGGSRGECAEFCGVYHPDMTVEVIALEPEAFDRWLAARGGRP